MSGAVTDGLSAGGRAAVQAYEEAIDGLPDTVEDVDGQIVADYVQLRAGELGRMEALSFWLLTMHGALTQWHEHLDRLCTVLQDDGGPGFERAQLEVGRYFAADQAVKDAVVKYLASTRGARPAPTVSESHGWELPLSAGSVSPFRPVPPQAG
ncbi:hypothetical protein [Streptomyces albogriseolus]|uniref:hypothetical protein n=1 Tax=Streptomyces albogriseolus TaxID=1887 RepID=UPI003461444C